MAGPSVKKFRYTGLLVCILATGCDSFKSDTMSLLRSGSEKVCVAPDVEQTLKALLMPTAIAFSPTQATSAEIEQALSEINISFDVTILSAFDKEVSKATCSTTVKVGTPSETVAELATEYTISPSAQDNSNFVVGSQLSPLKERIRSYTFARLNRLVNERLTAAQTSALLQVVNPRWLTGMWIGKDDPAWHCSEGLGSRYGAKGVYAGYESGGSWSLNGLQLLVRGEEAGETFSYPTTITQAEANTFTEKSSDGSTLDYRRCQPADFKAQMPQEPTAQDGSVEQAPEVTSDVSGATN